MSIEGIRNGSLFCHKWYIKGKGLDHGQNFPIENFFEYPHVRFASAEKISWHDNSNESFSVVLPHLWHYLFRICNSNFCTIQMKPLQQYSDTVPLFFIRNFIRELESFTIRKSEILMCYREALVTTNVFKTSVIFSF